MRITSVDPILLKGSETYHASASGTEAASPSNRPIANKTSTAVSVHLSIVRHQRGSTGSDTRVGIEP